MSFSGVRKGKEAEGRTSKGEPETAVRRKRSGGKSVTAGPLFDTGDELDETAVAECHTEDDVRRGDVPHVGIVEREDERGGAKAEQPEWRRIGEPTISSGPRILRVEAHFRW